MAKPAAPFAGLLLLLLLSASTLRVVHPFPSSASLESSVPPPCGRPERRLYKRFHGRLIPDCLNDTVNVRGRAESSSPEPRRWQAPLSWRRRRKRLRTAVEFLMAHNRVRMAEGEAPLEWDETLARHARRWSLLHRDVCANVHSDSPYGENMFTGTGKAWTAKQAVEIWAAEAEHYDRRSNTCEEGKMCGHYTQIVWNNTMRVGCARVRCFAGGIIITCNYDPPGNFVGESPFTFY